MIENGMISYDSTYKQSLLYSTSQSIMVRRKFSVTGATVKSFIKVFFDKAILYNITPIKTIVYDPLFSG